MQKLSSTFFIALAILAPRVAVCQESQVIDHTRICQECELEVEKVVELRALEELGGGVLGEPRSLIIDREGRYLTTDYTVGSEIRVFSPDGTFLKSVGRKGEGPGEYGVVNVLMTAPGDSLLAFDWNSRVSVLSGELEFGRSFSLQGHVHAGIRLRDGTIVINADLPTQDRIGFPLHTLSELGRVGQSFGSQQPSRRPGIPFFLMRSVSASEGSCLWSVPRTHYRLEEWCNGGTLKRILERDADWFEPWVDRQPVRRDSPPQPWIFGIQLDSSGLLWVLTSVPSEDWEELWEESAGRSAPRSNLVDTIVEVIDPQNARLVFSKKITQPAYGFVSEGRFFTYEEDERGRPSISVFELKLNISRDRRER